MRIKNELFVIFSFYVNSWFELVLLLYIVPTVNNLIIIIIIIYKLNHPSN